MAGELSRDHRQSRDLCIRHEWWREGIRSICDCPTDIGNDQGRGYYLLITIIKFKLQLEWCYASLVRLLAFHFTGFTPYIYTCNRLSPGLRAHKRNLVQPFIATIFPRCHWQTSDSPSSLVIVQSNITTIKLRLGRRLLFDSEQKNTNYLYTYTDSVSFRVEISSLLSSHRVDFK